MVIRTTVKPLKIIAVALALISLKNLKTAPYTSPLPVFRVRLVQSKKPHIKTKQKL